MWSLAKFVILCVVAAAFGLAAVSVPVGGKTAAEHLRALVEAHAPEAVPLPKAAPPSRAPTAAARPTPPRAHDPADRAPAEDPSDEDRAALERLIQKRSR